MNLNVKCERKLKVHICGTKFDYDDTDNCRDEFFGDKKMIYFFAEGIRKLEMRYFKCIKIEGIL